MEELITIQSTLKVPKTQRNNFGGYNYRSCEDILEAVKPIIKQSGCVLNICDDIICVGDRYYVKATATLTNKAGESISATAYAREDESKKGMDGSQITGTASSYARKYALNGLFCIDDTKDADTRAPEENQGRVTQQAAGSKANQESGDLITEKQIKLLYARARDYGISPEQVKGGAKKYFGKEHLSALTKKEMDILLIKFEGSSTNER